MTSYLVSRRRTNPWAIHAIIGGSRVVDPSYIDDIQVVADSKELNNEESFCPLEIDFDGAWPDASKALPPPPNEPLTVGDEAFEPNEKRKTVFRGYTFIFFDEDRYEDMMGPIQSGQGTPILYELAWGKSTAGEIVNYMKDLAAQQNGQRVGVMRTRPIPEGHGEWMNSLEEEIASASGQELIDIYMFLDAVLRNDAAFLIHPISLPPQKENVPPPPSSQAVKRKSGAVTADDNQTPSVPPGDTQGSGRLTKRLRGFASLPRGQSVFDDDFDLMTIREAEAEEEPSALAAPTPDRRCPSPSAVPGSPTELMDENILEDLIPEASNMHRQISEIPNRRRRSPSPQAAPTDSRADDGEKPRAKKPRLDIKEVVRQRREAEDKAAMERQREERTPFVGTAAAGGDGDEENIADGDAISKLRNLAIVEEMPVAAHAGGGDSLRRSRNASVSAFGSSSGSQVEPRWKAEWNGRKNFKKFRRQRVAGAFPTENDGEDSAAAAAVADSGIGLAASAAVSRSRSANVPLEEVSRRGYGLGDEFWEEDGDETQRPSRRPGTRSREGEVDAEQGRRQQRQQQEEQHDNDNDNNNDDDDDLADEIDDFAPPIRPRRRQTQASSNTRSRDTPSLRERNGAGDAFDTGPADTNNHNTITNNYNDDDDDDDDDLFVRSQSSPEAPAPRDVIDNAASAARGGSGGTESRNTRAASTRSSAAATRSTAGSRQAQQSTSTSGRTGNGGGLAGRGARGARGARTASSAAPTQSRLTRFLRTESSDDDEDDDDGELQFRFKRRR